MSVANAKKMNKK